MSYRFLTFSFVWLLSLGNALAQEDQMVTDRPDQTESAYVVPQGRFQLESGFVYYKMGSDFDAFDYNTSLLRYGLTKGVELRLGVGYIGYRIDDYWDEFNVDGFAPIVLGAKVLLTEEQNGLPRIALLGSFALPNTGAEEFQLDNLGVDIRTTMEYTLTAKVSLGANLGVMWSGYSINEDPSVIYSAVIGYAVNDKMGLFGELFGSLQSDSDDFHSLDMGLTYKVTDTFQLDASTGFGLSDFAPDNFVSFGFSVLF